MKKVTLTLALFLLIFQSLSAQTISALVAGNANFTTLNSALQATGLDDVLNGEGPFTVFAPTNNAFSFLQPNLLNAMLTDPDGVLTDMLLTHVVPGTFMSADLTADVQLTSASGQILTISTNAGGTFVSTVNIVVTNISASNGVIHVISVPISPITTDVFDIVANSPDHTIFETALVASGLNAPGVLSAPTFSIFASNYTLFAPTDAAFAALPTAVLDALLADPTGALNDLLLDHVVSGNVLSTNLSDGQVVETLGTSTFEIGIGLEGIFIGGAQITVTDLVGINGIVHVIDAVLAEPAFPSIYDIVESSEIHNTLEAALLAAGLNGVLSEPGELTLFAPTDAAFDALPANFVNALLTDPEGVLSDILLHHVLGSVAYSSDLSDGQTVQSLFGQDLTVGITNDGVFINNAQVIIADLVASNGVVHVIDVVFVPSTTTIADVVATSEVHTTLLAAVNAAGLVETLAGPGAFTLFAPTDAAFEALPTGLLDALFADPSGDLTSVLLHHVVDGIILSGDFTDGQLIATLFGETVQISIAGEDITVNGAQIVVADIITANGIVHVIDAVLVPQTLSTQGQGISGQVTVFPNPASHVVRISVKSERGGELVVRILNLLGQVIDVKTFGYIPSENVDLKLDVSNIQSGLYLIGVELGESVYTHKLQIAK